MFEQFGSQWHVPLTELNDRAIVLGKYNSEAGEEPICIDPRNTYLYIFGEGDDHIFNMLVHKLPSGERLQFSLHDPNIARWKDELTNGSYPIYHSEEPSEAIEEWYIEERGTVADTLPFPTPEDAEIDKTAQAILAHNKDPDYEFPEVLVDAISIATLQSAKNSGWLQSTGVVRLKGVTFTADPENTE